MTALLQADAVSRIYQRRGAGRGTGDEAQSIRAVDGVSLELDSSECFAIVGESGSGKSTLARLLLGMEQPDSGAIRFKGQDIHSLNRGERRTFRRSIQVVFQDPSSSLNPRMRVRDIIAEPLRTTSELSRQEFRARISAALAGVGLGEEAANRYPHQFSVGQRQRIAIARAIAVRPSYVVLDEPVSSLDVSVAAQITELLERIRRDEGIGYLIISHNLAHVRNVADRVAVMHRGRIVEQGTVEEVFFTPRDSYTKTLLAAIPRIGDPASGQPKDLIA